MKVLMLGWEFPPFISGGLGTACYGLTRGMSQLGTEVLFVLPKAVPADYSSHVRLLTPTALFAGGDSDEIERKAAELAGVTFLAVSAQMKPYDSMTEPGKRRFLLGTDMKEVDEQIERALRGDDDSGPIEAAKSTNASDYAGDLMGQVDRYARLVVRIAKRHDFDVIHAHDWLTYRGGIAAARISGKPLVVHVHSTEFDRSGENVNQVVYDVERAGMHTAARVITVSYLTKRIVTQRYGVDPDKIDVVYNAIDRNGKAPAPIPAIRRNERIVLFLGRITMQKGPEYFVRAAHLVLEKMNNVRFLMAGSGDMVRSSIELAADLGIGHKVLFTGFLRGQDVETVFRMADLYVMPSVSEPFGIAPLEAINHETPVLISKQSGVSEILRHALKVDFWDVEEMANKIIAVLRHPPLQATLREHSVLEVSRFSWRDSAANCIGVYQKAVGQKGS